MTTFTSVLVWAQASGMGKPSVAINAPSVQVADSVDLQRDRGYSPGDRWPPYRHTRVIRPGGEWIDLTDDCAVEAPCLVEGRCGREAPNHTLYVPVAMAADAAPYQWESLARDWLGGVAR